MSNQTMTKATMMMANMSSHSRVEDILIFCIMCKATMDNLTLEVLLTELNIQ